MPRHIAQDLAKDFKSSFLSCEKDMELILKKLFIENKPYSDRLKRLLVINNKDCLDETKKQYREIIKDKDLASLKDEQYVKIVPKLALSEFDEMKSFILLEFSDIVPSSNPEFRNMTVSFTIISPLDAWELNDYKLRPYQIAGYIDGILNNAKLSGIGTFNFMGASEIVLNEYFGGIILQYMAVHELTEDKSDTIVENPNLKLY